MSRWQATSLLLLGLCAPPAPAQETPSPSQEAKAPDLFAKAAVEYFPRETPPPRTDLQRPLFAPPLPVRRAERHPLEKYHWVHNENLHPHVVRWITSWHSYRNPHFAHWRSSRKGLTLFEFARGRLGLDFETQRVLLHEADRQVSTPFLYGDACPAGSGGSGTQCQSLGYKAGERRYSVVLRWKVGRR